MNKTSHPREAYAFVSYLRTPAAQQIFAENFYRPAVKSVARKFTRQFPARPGLFRIDQLGLGGWAKVQKEFFDVRRGIFAEIPRKVGGDTGG